MHADVAGTAWWDGTPFDGVVSSMSLMDIDDLDAAVARRRPRSCAPAAGSAWSIIHPCFPGVEHIRPSWPDRGYFSEGRWNTGGDGVRGRVGSNHRTLATYLNTVVTHGFVLEAAGEPRWQLNETTPAMPFFLVTRWRRR